MTRSVGDPPDRLKRFEQLLGLFPPGHLVDLGTGHGLFAKKSADMGWRVTAVDARTERWPQDSRITWVQQDVREHDLAPYDLILCLGVFYHLTCQDQLALLDRAAGRPMIIDTHVDHGRHAHPLSERVEQEGFEGRLYREPGRSTSSWINEQSFWPTLESFRRMLRESGYSTLLISEPWITGDRTFFVALPEGPSAGAESRRGWGRVPRVRSRRHLRIR
jgi:hypothetical protein